METKPEGPRLLIADDDAWMSRMLATVLGRRGYQIEAVGNGGAALESALARPPDLLITDAMMPILDGWTLIREFRSRPALAHVPVIVLSALSSEEDRLRGLRLGADAYVTKPFRYEEIDLRISSALRRAGRAPAEVRAADRACLEGQIEQVGVAGLLTLLEQERKTGRLVLRGPGDDVAELFLRDGRLIRATLRHAGGLMVDAACVVHLLRWGAGDFELLPCPVDGPDRVDASMTQLLLEGARQNDETDR